MKTFGVTDYTNEQTDDRWTAKWTELGDTLVQT